MSVFQEDAICLTQIAGGNYKFNGKVPSFAKPFAWQCHVSLYLGVGFGHSGLFYLENMFLPYLVTKSSTSEEHCMDRSF